MQLVGQTVVYDAPAIAGFPAQPPNVQALNFFVISSLKRNATWSRSRGDSQLDIYSYQRFVRKGR